MGGLPLRIQMHSYRHLLCSVQPDWFHNSTYFSVFTATLIPLCLVSLWRPLYLTFSVLFDIVSLCVCFGAIFTVTCSVQSSWSKSDREASSFAQTYKHTTCVLRSAYEAHNLPLNSASAKSNSNPLWQICMNDSNKQGCYVVCVVWSRLFFNEAPHILPTPFT